MIIHLSDCWYFSDIHISEGNVATCSKRGGILNSSLLQINCWVWQWKYFWKSLIIWWSYWQELCVFFWLTVQKWKLTSMTSQCFCRGVISNWFVSSRISSIDNGSMSPSWWRVYQQKHSSYLTVFCFHRANNITACSAVIPMLCHLFS